MRTLLLLTGQWTLLLLAMAWAGYVLWLAPLPLAARITAILLYALGTLLPPLVRPDRWQGLILPVILFAAMLAWFFTRVPSNERDWQADVAVLARAEFADDTVTIHGVRNCDYRTETDYTCRWESRTYNLADLQTVDLFVITWGAPGIAHTIASFGFGEAGYVCFSIETRKEKGEGYSAIKGFFRQYERIYVVADERDVIRLRTNVRREKVYLYPLKVRPALARSIFLDYLREVNRLRDRPQWYNALIANCTTSVRQHVVPYTPDAWLDWRLVANGFIDRLFYERGLVNQDLPFAELKERSFINKKAQAVDTDPDFSRRIREGLVRPESRNP